MFRRIHFHSSSTYYFFYDALISCNNINKQIQQESWSETSFLISCMCSIFFVFIIFYLGKRRSKASDPSSNGDYLINGSVNMNGNGSDFINGGYNGHHSGGFDFRLVSRTRSTISIVTCFTATCCKLGTFSEAYFLK